MISNASVVLDNGILNSQLLYTYSIVSLSSSIYNNAAHSFSQALRLLPAHAVFLLCIALNLFCWIFLLTFRSRPSAHNLSGDIFLKQ